MKTTEQRIREWLADPANIHWQSPAVFPERGFENITLRNRFVTTNGIKISIQQSATHYCDAASVEMWCCPHRPVLDPYGDGENPYGWVPLDVVAQYVDELEGEKK